MGDRTEYYKRRYRFLTKGSSEPTIKDSKEYFEKLKEFPANFPTEELNKGLDKMLENELPFEISEKKLKDMIYDILDKKGILSPRHLLAIYQNEWWTKSIKTIMKKRDYLFDEEKENYFFRNSTQQTSQK